MNLPRHVNSILDALLVGLRESLGHGLVGLYLRGSRASGDFIPDTSDVDVLAVTEHLVNDQEFASLEALHARIAQSPNPYANRLEIAYIDRASLRRFVPGRRYPTLGQGETLAWSEHGYNWVLERWMVREHGVTFYGPDPGTLIDPITSDELRAAVQARLRDWADWLGQPDDAAWVRPRRGAMAYAVETMCRCLHVLETGEVASKTRAVAWAIDSFSEPWRATVERSQSWRADPTVDHAIVGEVRRFVAWATGRR